MSGPSFSERMGFRQPKRVQVAEVDSDLQTGLWNALKYYLYKLKNSGDHKAEEYLSSLQFLVWTKYLGQKYDDQPRSRIYRAGYDEAFWQAIENWYFHHEREWLEFYDFLEFIGKFRFNEQADKHFGENLNRALEYENSAYRFVDGKFAPITNEQELEAVHTAVNPPTTALAPVSMHIQQALDLLSDKANPDYRNSMKESICAVESLCKMISGMSDKTLTPALEKTAKELGLHEKLREGFKNIYWYTCDEYGIRHGMKDTDQPDQEDARFMLIACSAFVNFVTEKARKQGKLPGDGGV